MEIKKIVNYQLDCINPTKETNPQWSFIPALRGQDQLNLYTFDYSLKTEDDMTGSNPWGLEVAVNNQGVVFQISDRVKIPADGYVLSGNSKGHKFLLDNIELGTKVSYDAQSKVLTVYINKIESTLYNLNLKINETNTRVKKAIEDVLLFDRNEVNKTLSQVDSLYTQLNKIKDLVSEENEELVNQFFALKEEILDCLTKIYCLTTPSCSIESRGVWYRPEDKNLTELLNTLNVMQKCNLNTLYVEAFFNGNIPGISKITDTCAEVKNCDYGPYGNDYLKALITEAHKRDIEVHAWVENFFVGERKCFDKDYPEEFRMVNYDGSTMQGPGDGNSEIVENGFIFLDPANPKVHQYVLSIYEELLTNYEFDGFHIDYVRYPNGNLDIKTSNGYSNYAMTEFKKLNGFNENDDVRELVKDNKINELWTKYRCDKITLMVKEVKELVLKLRPTAKISMAVVPETEYAIKNKMQDWVPWVKNGWIDITLPMAYYFGTSEIEVATRNLVQFNNNQAYSYTGIMPNYEGAPSIINAQQIEACVTNDSQGYAIFALHNILPFESIQEVLSTGPNRNKAVLPHSNYKTIINAYKEELLAKLVFFKENKELVNEKDFVNEIEKLNDFACINCAINGLSNFVDSAKKYLSGISYKAFAKQTNHAITILKIQQYQATKQ